MSIWLQAFVCKLWMQHKYVSCLIIVYWLDYNEYINIANTDGSILPKIVHKANKEFC